MKEQEIAAAKLSELKDGEMREVAAVFRYARPAALGSHRQDSGIKRSCASRAGINYIA